MFALGEFAGFLKVGRSSTTKAFVSAQRLLRNKEIGNRIVPIIPDEAAPSAWMGSSARSASIAKGSSMNRRSRITIYYHEAKDGQILEEEINEAVPGSVTAAGTAYATHGLHMIRFSLLIHVRLPAHSATRCGLDGTSWRGFLLGATAGRPTLNGEGLQHEDGHSLLRRQHHPTCSL